MNCADDDDDDDDDTAAAAADDDADDDAGVQVLVGSRRLDSSLVTSRGSHVLTVTSPVVPLTGHLQLRCHTRHAKLLVDTVSVTYVHVAQRHCAQVVWPPPGAADTVCPPACNNPTLKAFIAGHGS